MSRIQKWNKAKSNIRKRQKKANDALEKYEQEIARVKRAQDEELSAFADLRMLEMMNETGLPQVMFRPWAKAILVRSMSDDQATLTLDCAQLPRAVLRHARVVRGSLHLWCKSIGLDNQRLFELNVKETEWECESCEFISETGDLNHAVDLQSLFFNIDMKALLSYADFVERTDDQQFRVFTKWNDVYSFSLRKEDEDDDSESYIKEF